MARKAPCECGHPHSWHASGKGWCVPPDELPWEPWDDCLAYTAAKRKVPLRARRQWAPSDRRIEIHLHVDPTAYTAVGKAALIQFLKDVRREAFA